MTIAVWPPCLTLFLLGDALTGADAGAASMGSVSTVIAIAPPPAGGTPTGLFLAAYLGIGVPILASGLASQFVSGQTAVLGLAALLTFVAAVASRKLTAGQAAATGRPVRRNPREAAASPSDRHSGE